ncbi:hypothetical protein A374_01159 [Fictibacillus macauensis ZFHKF-1]|uniref:Uncharacterized protein n=1 Tax=Fictibacillus macauensis ZFHKF-1 TaxID=1196324 RepID=I8AN94_9BACL|nr:hypothetical protein [Fictibacillus macauensis]EIT87249.1 hypothetical protein A374_01159 [Fictibacillus macauensis ZFHKF-1]
METSLGESQYSSFVIDIKTEEMLTIIQHLRKIANELMTNANPCLEILAHTNFYHEGAAKSTMKAYNSAISKMNELLKVYSHAGQLMDYYVQKMIDKDEELAKIFNGHSKD